MNSRRQLFAVFFLLPALAFAQGDFSKSYITVENISLTGNKRTKPEIILRELDFKTGDTIALATLTSRLEQNQFNLMNTGLFTVAKIYYKTWEGETNRIGLQIDLTESWYVFPFPIVELADRNFNVWWDDYDHSLRRLNLGVRFYHTNFTGRKDQLKAVAQVGFTKKFELIYTLPFFNKRRNLGLNLNFLHTREKEIGYNTLENKLLFHRNADDPLLRRFRFGAGLLFRRQLDIYHQWNLAWHHNIIHESVPQELNPDFFLDGLHQQYLALSYDFAMDKRDIKPYPMHGFLLATSITAEGLGISDDVNSVNLTAQWRQYIPASKRWNIELIFKEKAGLIRQKQPYYQSTALGYEQDYIRGYEYYVIDGLDYVYHKGSLRFELFNRDINWGKYALLDAFKVMPVKIFLALHNEVGYVNNPYYNAGNSLSNNLLWGTSAGVDVVIYYDKVFNIEYSRNRLGEHGLFLHWTFSF